VSRVSLLLAAYAGWGLLYIWRTSFVLGGERVFVLWDDAMISLRYAQHLVAGQGLVWNAGESVQGISNLGVTLAMAALHALPVSPLRVSLLVQLANLGLLLLILVLAQKLARALSPGDGLVAVLAAATAALYAPLSIWSLQGSDVAPVTACVLGALVLSAGELRARRGLARPAWALLALGVVLRLDVGVVYAACIGFALLQGRGAWRSAAQGAALFALTLAAILGLGWLYYGDPLPNTFYLKATGAPLADVITNGLEQLWEKFTPLSPLSIALVVVGIILLRRDPLCALTALCVLALFVYDLSVGGDWLKAHHSRFVVPAVALFCVLNAVAARAVLARWLPAPRLAAPGGRLALAGLSLLGAFAFYSPVATREWLWPGTPTLWWQENRDNARIGFYLREQTPPELSVALHCAGTTAYFAERPAIDVLGKSDRHIAKLPVRVFHPGHSKWDWDYVLLERRPDVITETSRGLDNHPELARRYYYAQTRDGLAFHVRKDALARVRDHGLALYAFRSRRPLTWDEAVALAAADTREP
jgi:arabinofuranosyltransferase